MSTSPSTDNYTLGRGVVSFDQILSGAYIGERDLGSAPAFSFSISFEKLEHFNYRSGRKSKDLEIISQITPGISFTLDEISKENMSLLTLGDISSVTQAIGSTAAEEVTANLGTRSQLAFRGIASWNIPYDTGTGLFVAGETFTAAGGGAGIVLSVVGDITSGTLIVAKTNDTAFVDDGALTGSIAGVAAINSTTGGSANVGAPAILVQDAADTITYVEDTDYEIVTSLSDDSIGRVKFLEGGSIVDASTVHVTYGHSALTYTNIATFAQDIVKGKLRFVSDNPAGEKQELEIWNCSLTPDGDTAMIGDDWSTLSFTGEILKDSTNHPESPYMNIIMEQELA